MARCIWFLAGIMTNTATYLALLIAAGALLIALVHYVVRRIEARQRRRIEQQERFAPVQTSSPVDQPRKSARETALRSIQSRFSIIRHGFHLTLFFILVFAVSLPFVNRLPVTAVSVVVAASGVIIGIAARPVLENLMAGVLITFSGAFRVGDTLLIDQNYGTIEDITMTHTIIKVWDWRRYVVPNSQMITKDFLNLTLKDSYQWCYVEFWIAHDADLELAKQKAVEVAAASQYFAGYEAPRVWVMELGKEGIRCWVAAWAATPSDAWALGNDIRTQLARELRLLRIPPHRYHLSGLPIPEMPS